MKPRTKPIKKKKHLRKKKVSPLKPKEVALPVEDPEDEDLLGEEDEDDFLQDDDEGNVSDDD